MVSKTVLYVSGAAAFVVAGSVFFTLAWTLKPPQPLSPSIQNKLDLIDEFLTDAFASNNVKEDFDQVDPKHIMDVLKNLSAMPHLAGDARDLVLADYIKDQWIEYGLDHVEIKNYAVLLDYPNKTNPNRVQLFNGTSILYESVYQEEGVDTTLFVDAYLAYSPSGQAEGNMVYVNYGTKEDFELLANSTGDYNTDVSGMICIARYGQIYRGNKAKNAEVNNCKALVLFSDPADVAAEGQNESDVYPNTIFLPDTGIQRGSLAILDGDPETPRWPSLPNVHRLTEAETAESLPKIPCQNIGYRGAKELLKRLKGQAVPQGWAGGIDIEYTIGGEFTDDCTDCKVVVTTNNHLERRPSPNVMGYIRGSVEPDRYVMIGNHRDAWGFGSIDPSSGTAQMMEVSRVLGAKVLNGWRPRRTIIFLSWGAEEFALTGSREFVEDYKTKLIERGVVYINVDVCAGGPILEAAASPTIAHKLIDAIKAVPALNSTYNSYYDFWYEWLELKKDAEPEIWLPGAGSDHASFIFYAGIPVIDFGFSPNSKKHPSLKNIGYPMYHTAYETFKLVNVLVDADAAIMATSAKISLYLVRDFADSMVLDFDLQRYSKVMEEFKKDPEVEKLRELDITTVNFLIDAIDKFENSTRDFHTWLDSKKLEIKDNPMMAKYINDQMMNLDKKFLMDEGLPGSIYNHAIISPGKFNSYGSGYFPGISDHIYNFDSQTDAEKERRVKILRKHVSDLMIIILRAVDHLKEIYLL